MSECKTKESESDRECEAKAIVILFFLFCVFAWVFLSCDLFTIMIAGGINKAYATVEYPCINID